MVLIEGLTLGLANNLFCVGTCAPALLPIILAPSMLKDNDLAVTPLLHNAPADGYVFQQGMSNLHLIVITNKDHLIQGDFTADLPWKFFKLNHFAGFDSVLFATRLKYRIHFHTLQVHRSRAVSFLSAIMS